MAVLHISTMKFAFQPAAMAEISSVTPDSRKSSHCRENLEIRNLFKIKNCTKPNFVQNPEIRKILLEFWKALYSAMAIGWSWLMPQKELLLNHQIYSSIQQISLLYLCISYLAIQLDLELSLFKMMLPNY